MTPASRMRKKQADGSMTAASAAHRPQIISQAPLLGRVLGDGDVEEAGAGGEDQGGGGRWGLRTVE